MKKLFILPAAVFIATLTAVPFTSRAEDASAATTAAAAEQPVQPCDFRQGIAGLQTILQTAPLTDLEAADLEQSELEARKNILRDVIACAKKRISDRQSALNALAPELRNSTIGYSLAADLGTSSDFYDRELSQIDGATIEETKSLARSVSDWRSRTYARIANQEDNFVLWAKNQPLFSKTAERLSQAKTIVLSLKWLDHPEFESLYDGADKAFAEASQKNDAAKKAVENSSPEAILPIKDSLESLAGVYKQLLDLSDAIKKIVP